MWMYENGHILSSCSHSVFIYHALFLIIMTSMMEMAISSGIDNDAAIWLMIFLFLLQNTICQSYIHRTGKDCQFEIFAQVVC